MKGIKGILITIVLLGALGAGVVLVRKNQETRRGAYYSQAEFYTTTVIPANLEAGSTFVVNINLDTKGNPVNAIMLRLEPVNKEIASIEAVKAATDLFTEEINVSAVNGGATIQGLIMKAPADLPKSVHRVATIIVRAIKTGNVEFKMTDYEVVTSNNRDGDNTLEMNFRGESIPVGSSGTGSVWVDFTPATEYVKVGQERDIVISLDTGDSKISGLKLNLGYNKQLTEIVSFTGISGYNWSGWKKDTSSAESNLGNLLILGTANSSSAAKGGENMEIGVVRIKALAEGEDSFILTAANNQVTDLEAESLKIIANGTRYGYENNVVCSDSDDGKIYGTKGTARISVNGQDGDDPKVDFCTESVLTEYFCNGTSRESENYTCADGCEAGACKLGVAETDPKVTTECSETDGGDDSTKKGTTTLTVTTNGVPVETSSTDTCSSTSTLTEYYCGTDKSKQSKSYTCSEGFTCDGGACVVGVNTTDPGNPPISGDGDETDSVVNFRVAFAGLSGEAKCWADPTVGLTVMGSDGVLKVYKNVSVTKDGSKNSSGLTVYRGSYRLAGFTAKSSVAVFVKGPQHAQVKFGKNGQSSFYNQPGGELTLTNGSDSPVYNFSEYPILAGDFTGESDGVPDGKIDGRDFSYIKERTSALSEVDENTLGDINGDCAINSYDVGTFMKSFNEKMDQMY